MNYANIRPIGEKVLVKRKETPKVSKGGIYLPEEATDLPLEAEVIAKGDGIVKTSDGPDRFFEHISVNDKILMSQFGGQDVGDGYLILPMSCILGIFIKENTLMPFGDRALVKLNQRKEQSDAGIIIPEFSRGAEEWGEVVRVGDEGGSDILGKRTYIPRHLGTHYILNGTDYIIIERNKLTVIED